MSRFDDIQRAVLRRAAVDGSMGTTCYALPSIASSSASLAASGRHSSAPAAPGTASMSWRYPNPVTARLALRMLVVVLRTLLALGAGLIAGWLVWRIALTHPLAVGVVSGALVFVLVFAAAMRGEREEREHLGQDHV